MNFLKKYSLVFFLSILIFTNINCERKFKIDVPESTGNVVVEAIIENDQFPYLTLTKSFSLFSTLDADQIANIFVHNAEPVISGGGQTIPLKEYHFGNIYFYTLDGLSLTAAPGYIKMPSPFGDSIFINPAIFNPSKFGKLNTTYTLNISFPDGSHDPISAVTSIGTNLYQVDSIYQFFKNNDTSTHLAALIFDITNNPTYKENYRYFTSVNGNAFLPGYTSTFNDDLINGTSYTFRIDRGLDKTSQNDSLFKDYPFFHTSDSVVVKICSLDRNSFDFWSTYDNAYSNSGNPFAAPSNVKSNIVGGLGVFSGYASKYYKYYFKKK